MKLDAPVFNPAHAFSKPAETLSTGPDFDGATYEPSRDKDRLTGQLERVYKAVKDGRWLTLAGIASRTGDPEASISAQLRNLRKLKFGAYDIRKRRVGNVFEYTCAGRKSDNDNQDRLF
jgi:hypothetical protein